ncbi:hypothetical protein WQ57_25240 [Mesobacillus campisalis]|uniref:Periplasmic immunogenic protein n=1 Tax=Mesobacillus campisalis TaxID=1408103 RepID=A0A0M2SG20_9BACI|nr:SIMPL domain-containing protein [Mesobacillus campisalis]KKK33228.1 hypothetical protein WQ57_25240 [Mesobacillus campisalis]
MHSGQEKVAGVNKRATILVRGKGIVTARPDTASIVIGAVTEDENLQKAQSENASRINAVLTALIQLGLSREQIQTTDYRIEPYYQFEDGKQEFKGYRVTHMLTVNVPGPERAGTVVEYALNSGANELAGITFSSSISQQLTLRALTLAMNDAFSKASAIANSIGVQIHQVPDEVVEEHVSDLPPLMAMDASTGSVPVEPGSIKISAAVTVRYSYKKQTRPGT